MTCATMPEFIFEFGNLLIRTCELLHLIREVFPQLFQRKREFDGIFQVCVTLCTMLLVRVCLRDWNIQYLVVWLHNRILQLFKIRDVLLSVCLIQSPHTCVL